MNMQKSCCNPAGDCPSMLEYLAKQCNRKEEIVQGGIKRDFGLIWKDN